MFGRRGGAGKRRLGIHETTLENDIQYRGPLSSTHFKVLGWLCIVIAQVAVLLRLGGRLDPAIAADGAAWLNILGEIAELALPFLLIANFARLIDVQEDYKKQLIVNGAATAAVCGLYYLVFYRYTVDGLAALLQDPSEALPAVRSVLALSLPYGFLAFNIFVDLFLCTLTMIFLNYDPKRLFTGKARIFFRLLALLPIGYEVGCMLLKLNAARGLVRIPEWAYPLLTVKPPMTFVLFVALSLFVKTRELRFRRHGKTHEEYQAFLKTRRNSWNFSVYLAIMLVIVSIADIAVVLGISIGETMRAFNPANEPAQTEAVSGEDAQAQSAVEARLAELRAALEDEMAAPEADRAEESAPDEEALREAKMNASIDTALRLAKAVGFGGSVYLLFLAPVVLLFSYTRKPKNRLLDALIPVAGVALILLVYVEGFHRLLSHLPIQKLNLQELRDTAAFYLYLLK